MQARPEYLNPSQEKLASYNQGWNNATDEYFFGIKELQSADAECEWIPVSERLPEPREDGKPVHVLVTLTDEACLNDNVYEAFFNRKYNGEWAIGEHYQYGNESILAWMPLPEPYKE